MTEDMVRSEQVLPPTDCTGGGANRRERPILFSAPMVNAILSGRKTQTRRIVKPQPDWERPEPCSSETPEGWQGPLDYSTWAESADPEMDFRRCPYGAPGDRLWVRESGELLRYAHDHDPTTNRDIWRDAGWVYPDGEIKGAFGCEPPVSEWIDDCSRIGRPSIHMPRWASRITLEITKVRVERLQDISWDDAIAEGVRDMGRMDGEPWPHCYVPGVTRGYEACAIATYLNLWEHINGDGSVKANPWVWAVSFRRVEQQARAS